ncbi:DUF5677 domain-containing protein [Lacisediminihabitans sp. FW035]
MSDASGLLPRGTNFKAPAAAPDPVHHENLPDPASIRAFMKKHIALWDRDAERPFEMRSEYVRGTGPIIWSLANHTAELARTIVELSAADRMIIAIPLIRLCVENAMTAAWMLVTPDAVEATLHEGMRQRRAAIKEVLEQGLAGFNDESLQAAERDVEQFAGNKSVEGKSIEQRFKALKGGAGVYVTYRILSSLSHAGMTLGDHYLTEIPVSPEAPAGVAFDRERKLDNHEAWLGTAAAMLIVAMTASDRTDFKGRHKNQLIKAAKVIQIDTDFELIGPAPEGE